MHLIMISMIMTMMSALMAMAFYTLSERKFLGYMQLRKGPNKPMFIALSIPMADAMKLFSKEEKTTTMMNQKYFLIASSATITISLFMYPIYSHYNLMFFLKFSILYLLSISSASVYTTFMAGWSSNSKWGLLGALRGIAQTISYEVSMSLILLLFIMYPSSMSTMSILQDQYSWLITLMIPMSMMWMMTILAETHRSPMDFTEGESELVSGFNVEYSSSPFALIFMAEYMSILLMSILSVTIMTKNYHNMDLILKSTIMSFIFIWARGSLPRLRYDILMNILWKKFLPFNLMWLMLTVPLVLMMK